MENRPPYEVLGLTGQESQFSSAPLEGSMQPNEAVFFSQDGKRFTSHVTPNGVNRLVEIPHDPVAQRFNALPTDVRDYLDVDAQYVHAQDPQSKAELDEIRMSLLKSVTGNKEMIDALGDFLIFRNQQRKESRRA